MSEQERASIRDRRIQYETTGLGSADLSADPMEQWHVWHSQAFDAGVAEPNTMVLSTVDLQSHPDSRAVLVRDAPAEPDGALIEVNGDTGQVTVIE